MNPSFEDLKQELKNKNINLSFQRLKVLDYMVNNRCHPTVDHIFTEIHKDIPTLSKTTVYNTLKVLVDAGLVRVISIDDNEARYDIDVANHGHFQCEDCKEIFDFKINIDNIESKDLNGFLVEDKNVYFKGKCPSCVSNKKASN